jgi:glycosyltransferase involved in cell wall biosynthesis
LRNLIQRRLFISSSKFKIGVVGLVDKSGGGILQYTQSLIDALSLCPDFDIVYLDRAETLHTDKLATRRLCELRSNLKKMLRVFLLVLRIRSRAGLETGDGQKLNDIDFFISPIIAHYPHYWTGKPFLLTYHDLQERYFPEFFSLKEKIKRWLLGRALVLASSHLLCESSHVKSDLIRFFSASPRKIDVIAAPPQSVDLDEFQREKLRKRAKIELALPDQYFFYPAQFWPHKNHIRLLEALKLSQRRNPNLKIVLCGSKQNYFNAVMAHAEKIGIRESVIYPGYVSQDHLMGIFLGSTGLVMPSLFESVSIPIYEAFQLGVPVCASNLLAIPEQVGNAGILFDPFDAASIASAMDRLIIDSALRQKLIAEGKIKSEKHSVTAYAASLNTLLNKLTLQ